MVSAGNSADETSLDATGAPLLEPKQVGRQAHGVPFGETIERLLAIDCCYPDTEGADIGLSPPFRGSRDARDFGLKPVVYFDDPSECIGLRS